MKRYLCLEDMSNVNCANVLSIIREAGIISRKEICSKSGLSWAGMTKIVNKLFEKGFLEETKSTIVSSGAGRIPNLIKICEDRNVVLGIDINREGFSANIMNLAGNILKEYETEVEYSNKEQLLGRILTFIANIIKNHSCQRILAIGVAMQGMLDVENGISIDFPHCEDWKNVPIRDILYNHFNYKVYVEHDPNCMLFSTLYKDTAENSILFRIDRSIGMAAYIDGKILRGNGILEVKNCIVNPEGKEGAGKKRGTLEAYVSDCLHDKAYHAEGMKELIPLFVNFAYNIAHVFNAARIVLTGELITYKERFDKELLEEFSKYAGKEELEIIYVEETRRVAFGASLIAAQSAIDAVEI